MTACDLTTTHVSDALTQAFCCGKLVLASVTYDGGLFPPMEELLNHLKAKNFQNRKIGLMENGSWAPQAARLMRARLEEMKNLTLCPTAVSIRSALNEGSRPAAAAAGGRAAGPLMFGSPVLNRKPVLLYPAERAFLLSAPM